MKSSDLIAVAIASGEAEALHYLEHGNDAQQIAARNYLTLLENLRNQNNRPIYQEAHPTNQPL